MSQHRMNSSSTSTGLIDENENVILIGDIHGNLKQLISLWSNLRERCGPDKFDTAKIIFLGDYIDRGPETSGVLEFLSSLSHTHPNQKHVFLIGNHDFGLICFLKLWNFDAEVVNERINNRYSSRRPAELPLYDNIDEAHDMHIQGKRWCNRGKQNVFNSKPTFSSYNVPYGERSSLLSAIPEHHKRFLSELKFIYQCDLGFVNLIAIHAGISCESSISKQIETLQSIDENKDKILDEGLIFVEQISGRGNVQYHHPEQKQEGSNLLIASGHHGFSRYDKQRLIIDRGGGVQTRPIEAAIINKERQEITIVDSNNTIQKVLNYHSP